MLCFYLCPPIFYLFLSCLRLECPCFQWTSVANVWLSVFSLIFLHYLCVYVFLVLLLLINKCSCSPSISISILNQLMFLVLLLINVSSFLHSFVSPFSSSFIFLFASFSSLIFIPFIFSVLPPLPRFSLYFLLLSLFSHNTHTFSTFHTCFTEAHYPPRSVTVAYHRPCPLPRISALRACGCVPGASHPRTAVCSCRICRSCPSSPSPCPDIDW